jgi:hypothetical protein
MTRKEVYEFYDELKKTGKLKEFQRKRPSEMTKKEQDLFYYDDGEVMYNPFVGVLDKIVKGSSELGLPLTEERRKALGLYPGMKTKSYSEMTPKEQKLFDDYD